MNLQTHLAVTTGSLRPALARGEKIETKNSPLHLARPELWVFAGLILVFSGSVFFGSTWHTMMFQPVAVRSGEWWRLLTHPFVHLTWYHLLLDASAFLLLYQGLLETKMARRLYYVIASAVGSLLLAWLAAPAISSEGLCGLSGIAHGLMAISAVEMMLANQRASTEWRIGFSTFAIVVAKAAFEAISGRVLFAFLYFGMMGEPVTVSHAGGIVGGLVAMLILRLTHHPTPPAPSPRKANSCNAEVSIICVTARRADLIEPLIGIRRICVDEDELAR